MGCGRGEPGDGRRRELAAPEAEGELAVGFFGGRYERATLRAAVHAGHGRDRGRPGADISGGRRTRAKPSSLSPARDGLIKKGLIYSSERGLIAFTVPHFGKFLRSRPYVPAALSGYRVI